MTSRELRSALPDAAPYRGRRDRSIDVIRGFCIASMVTAHLAGNSMLSGVFHVFPKFDGASGFVLLGGLVLGMVQSRRMSSDGLGAVQRKSARRLAMIYLAQVALVAIGVAAALRGWDSTNFPRMSELSGGEVLAHVLMMTLAPPGGDVLRLYVFMLALAMGAYALLRLGHWRLVLVLSVALHVAGQFFPKFTSFSPYPEQAPSAGWAGWQLLFISALVLGWHWKRIGAASWLDRYALRVFLVAVSTALAFALTSVVLPEVVEEVLFSKYTFGVGRIVIAYSAVAAMYIALRWALRKMPRLPVRPLAMIGSRSLDSYIVQAVVVVLMFGFGSVDSTSLLAQSAAVGTLLLCWAWAELRAAANLRRHRDSSN